MDSAAANTLIEIFTNSDIFLLIFVRMIGMIFIMPVIGGRSIPVVVRVGLALALASIVYSSGMVTEVFYYNSIMGYAFVIIKEFFVGFIIGFIVYFIFNATYLAGQLVDQQIGLSMISIFDPITQTQVPIMGNLFYFGVCALMIVSGGHRMIISTLFYSYKAIPVGAATIINNGALLNVFIEAMSQFFLIGTTIALPIIGIILVMDVVLGVLVKAVPKLNVFVVGMPAKIFIGLFGVWLIIPLFGKVYVHMYDVITELILQAIKVMMP